MNAKTSATGSPAPRLQALLALAALLALPLAHGCAGGGGSSSGGSVSSSVGSSTGGSAGTGNAATQSHRNAALAALGSGGAPTDLAIDGSATAVWDGMIARAWPELRRAWIDPRIEQEVTAKITGLAPAGNVTITGLRNLVIDTAAAPGAAGGTRTGTRQQLLVQAPMWPGAWHLSATVDVTARVTVSVLGLPITIGTSFDVTADVSDIRVEAAGTLDYANAANPALVSAGTPSAHLTLTLSSSDPLFQQVAGTLTSILDPVIRVAIVGGAIYAQQQIMPLFRQYTTMPFRPSSSGPAQGVAGAPSLEAAANDICDEIQAHHVPWDMCLPAFFTDPAFGQGTPVEYADFGDCVGWTSYYMAGEAIRHDLTGEPKALAAVQKSLRGIQKCLDVSGAGQGMLARTIIPVSDPLIRQISQDTDYYEGDINGVRYGATGDMSRDHNLDSLFGSIQVWLRIPSLRPQAATIITQINGYIQRNDYIVYKKPGSTELSRASPWAQAPGAVWGFAHCSAIVDPARFSALEAQLAPITSLLWLNFWGSRLDVQSQYYKHCLGSSELTFLSEPETDPARYRDVAKAAAIHHDGVKDHDNPWFDCVWGMVVPSQASLMGPRIQNALERWTLRPRRVFPTDLHNDPAIPKTTFTNPETGQPEEVAAEPVPIEKRPPNDYLWQRSPFDLDNWGLPPTFQYCGIDLTQPYWTARAYGMVR